MDGEVESETPSYGFGYLRARHTYLEYISPSDSPEMITAAASHHAHDHHKPKARSRLQHLDSMLTQSSNIDLHLSTSK